MLTQQQLIVMLRQMKTKDIAKLLAKTATVRSTKETTTQQCCSRVNLENSNDLYSLFSVIQASQQISMTTSALPKKQLIEQKHLQQKEEKQLSCEDIKQQKYNQNDEHEQQQQTNSSHQTNSYFSFTSNLNENGCCSVDVAESLASELNLFYATTSTQDIKLQIKNKIFKNSAKNIITNNCSTSPKSKQLDSLTSPLSPSVVLIRGPALTSSASLLYLKQSIQKIFQQQIHHFHTHNQSLWTKQKQTKFAMSSLATEPLTALKQDDFNDFDAVIQKPKQQQPQTEQHKQNGINCHSTSDSTNSSTSSINEQSSSSASALGKPCFNTGLPEILKFMELIGNLKHTKRTGWVLRDVSDCESISGHMYRMSILTFLLDGSEGLNQIRCMELALVHDMAESLVGDITPFCGITKDEKRAMEFKAMQDICNLIEPRGKRIMELFEEYENGESAESKFVKDLDRLDMVMQAFEYEKRDNCLLKHQEFFDSTEGKFNHPFVKKLVNEIYEQREVLAKAKGATPPPAVEVPDMEAKITNGHSHEQKTKNGNSS